MEYSKQVRKIRTAIQKYKKLSIIRLLLQRLHSENADMNSAFHRPWVTCLMLEWTLELTEIPNAKEASSRDVHKILNRIWELQSPAIDLDSTTNVWLSMRAFLLTQLRFQRPRREHVSFLIRLHYLLCNKNSSSYYRDTFQKYTNVNIEDFFLISIFFIFGFSKSSSVINFKHILPKLSPSFSVETIADFLNCTGSKLSDIHVELSELRIKNGGEIKKDEYFSEPKLISTPILIFPNGISNTHEYVFSIGITEFIFRTLRLGNAQKFMLKFTKDFEEYIYKIFKYYNLNVIRESEIKEIYNKNNIKDSDVIDFIHNNNDYSVFIESKGVIPNQKNLVTSKGYTLKNTIKDYHIKAICQVAECIQSLSKTDYNEIVGLDNRFLLVVTHQDFFLGDGVKLVSYLEDEDSVKIKTKIDGYIKLENIHFCSVCDFEDILYLCENSSRSLGDFLSFCTKLQMSNETSKFEMLQMIKEFSDEVNVKTAYRMPTEFLQKDLELLESKLKTKVAESRKYWSCGDENRMIEYLKNFSELKYRIKI